MKPCQHCQGEGIIWVAARDTHPMSNVHRRHYRTSGGRHGKFYGDNLLLDIGESLEWSFNCHHCHGRGIIEWSRGKSLVPACS